MTTYADILLKKELICNLAKQFGFTDEVKICYYLPEKADNKIELRFVVKETAKQISYKNSSWLGAKLSAELDCDVSITVYDGVDNLSKYDTDRRSVLISDQKAIKEVIHRINNHIYPDIALSEDDLAVINDIKLENIECKSVPKEDQWLQDGVLKNAEEYLKKTADVHQKTTADTYSVVGVVGSLVGKSPSPIPQKRKPPAKSDETKKAKLNDEKKDGSAALDALSEYKTPPGSPRNG